MVTPDDVAAGAFPEEWPMFKLLCVSPSLSRSLQCSILPSDISFSQVRRKPPDVRQDELFQAGQQG